jgi:hypothetical protein
MGIKQISGVSSLGVIYIAGDWNVNIVRDMFVVPSDLG